MDRERDVSTAPVILPSIYQRNVISTTFRTGFQTAPVLSNSSNRFATPSLSPLTKKQNQRLSEQLKLLNKLINRERDGQGTSLLEDSMTEHHNALALSFDKNWQELMQLIGIELNINDRDGSRELFSSDLGMYSKSAKAKLSEKQDLGKDSQNNPKSTTKNIVGRKPIRAITQDLHRRLNMLKTNPSQWSALEQAVEQYLPSNLGNQSVNLVRRNKKQLNEWSPVAKRRRNMELKTIHQEHMDKVLAMKARLDRNDIISRTRAIKEKEERLARNLAADRDYSANFQQVQARFFVVVVVAARVHYIKTKLQNGHREYLLHLNRVVAAKIIQRWYRKIMNKKLLAKKAAALAVISKAFKVYYAKWKDQRLAKASKIIHSFFQEVYDVSKLLKVVKKYRLSVVKAQRYVRNFLKIQEYKIKVILVYWDSMENIWWLQRGKGAITEAEEKKSKQKKKKKGKDDNDKLSLKLPV